MPDIGIHLQEHAVHLPRRTKASIIYKGISNVRTVQIPLGHAKIKSTICYLGVDAEDALELPE